MIYLNKSKFPVDHYPDGTQLLKYDKDFIVLSQPRNTENNYFVFDIKWVYENDEELVTIYFLTKHLQNTFTKHNEINLFIYYCPNARQDRVKSDCEIFTLKYFAELINSLNFNKVYIADPHSDVATALFNRVEVYDITYLLNTVSTKFKNTYGVENSYVYFPDAGAMKRYKDMIENSLFKPFKKLYGAKERDWESGKIVGLRIHDEHDNIVSEDQLKDASVIMIDDIISYGGTLYYSAKKLKELGVGTILAYATHTENSVLDQEKGTFIKCLEDGTVKGLYTTNSLYSGKHDKIYAYKLF